MRPLPTVVDVSDHAVLRWLERVHGIDVAAIRAMIGGDVAAGAAYGASAVRLGHVRYHLTRRAEQTGAPGVVVVATVTVQVRDRRRPS